MASFDAVGGTCWESTAACCCASGHTSVDAGPSSRRRVSTQEPRVRAATPEMKQTRKGFANWQLRDESCTSARINAGIGPYGQSDRLPAVADKHPVCLTCCTGREAGRSSAIRRTGRTTIESFSRPGGCATGSIGVLPLNGPPEGARWRIDQPGARFADPGPRGEHAFRIVKQTVGLRQSEIPRPGQEPGTGADHVCAG